MVAVYLLLTIGDPNHIDADEEPTFHFVTDPDPSFQIKAQNREKVLKLGHIPCHLQIDADPDAA